MPYIEQKDRDLLAAGATPANAGELNYTITTYLLGSGENPSLEYSDLFAGVRSIVDAYVRARPLSYRLINEVIGVLTCAAQEAARRDAAEWVWNLLIDLSLTWYGEVAGPYEDAKIASNGDVY